MNKHADHIIVAKLIAHDEQALFSLYKTYNLALYNFIYKKLQDKQLAEELTQDVFIELVESLRDFRFQCSLKTFLFTIARNKAIDYIRRKKLKRILFSALPSFVVEGLASVVMDDDIEKKEVQQKIEKTLQKLPHEYQIILRLKYIEEKPVGYIAEKLLKTFKSTESLLFRARKAFIKAYGTL
ncbi:MAG TPA: RNA polymerase sigma factor [Candidatus Woesebacteria bacterium]|nr:RNA polymerase sigma factor [Candidatus Woesebacteria bacterium]